MLKDICTRFVVLCQRQEIFCHYFLLYFATLINVQLKLKMYHLPLPSLISTIIIVQPLHSFNYWQLLLSNPLQNSSSFCFLHHHSLIGFIFVKWLNIFYFFLKGFLLLVCFIMFNALCFCFWWKYHFKFCLWLRILLLCIYVL